MCFFLWRQHLIAQSCLRSMETPRCVYTFQFVAHVRHFGVAHVFQVLNHSIGRTKLLASYAKPLADSYYVNEIHHLVSFLLRSDITLVLAVGCALGQCHCRCPCIVRTPPFPINEAQISVSDLEEQQTHILIFGNPIVETSFRHDSACCWYFLLRWPDLGWKSDRESKLMKRCASITVVEAGQHCVGGQVLYLIVQYSHR